MATITEHPETTVKEPARAQAAPVLRPEQPVRPVPQYRPLFADSLLENPTGARKRRGATTMFSFSIQMVILAILALLPLMFTEALPKGQLLTFLVAPAPPPPPPPPPAAAPIKMVRETDVLKTGALRTPTAIPKKIEMLKEEEAPPPISGGVVGGVPGGIPGGQTGGVIGSIITTPHTVALPKFEAPKRVRISQGVTQGLLVHRVEPRYPKIALTARVTGVVQLHAIIGRDGAIKELEAVSGHPMLIPAAIEAVKEWRYRPYLLNGEAVEVETNVTVTFQLSQ